MKRTREENIETDSNKKPKSNDEKKYRIKKFPCTVHGCRYMVRKENRGDHEMRHLYPDDYPRCDVCDFLADSKGMLDKHCKAIHPEYNEVLLDQRRNKAPQSKLSETSYSELSEASYSELSEESYSELS